MTSPEVSQYWDDKAETLRADASATMKDVILRSLEIEAIGSRLKPDDQLLDVGGGNAFAGIRWSKHCKSVLVTDFSAKMVQYGNEAIVASDRENVRTEQASVLDLSAYRGCFSATTCVRCLINLPSEADQSAAIDQLTDTLRPGGRLFLIEGLEGTFVAMNQMRSAMGLPAVELDWHNRLLKREQLESALSRSLEISEQVDFGEYYFLSRIIHPLIVAPDEPAFQSVHNNVAKRCWQQGVGRGRFADISTLVLYVGIKR